MTGRTRIAEPAPMESIARCTERRDAARDVINEKRSGRRNGEKCRVTVNNCFLPPTGLSDPGSIGYF